MAQSVLAFDGIREKAFKLLGFVLPVSTIVIGYFISHDVFSIPLQFLPAITVSITLFIGVLLLILVILPQNIYPVGTMPVSLIRPSHILEGDDKLQYVAIVLNLCESIQDRINANRKKTNRSALFLTIAIAVIGVISPVAYFVASLIKY